VNSQEHSDLSLRERRVCRLEFVTSAVTMAASSPGSNLPDAGIWAGRPSSDHQRISDRAYALYVQNGYRDGHALEDWLLAEQEVSSQVHRAS
jgi:hypothetical protein